MSTSIIRRLTSFILLCGFAVSANAIPISATFDDLDQKTIGTAGQGVFGTFDFEIVNNTGITWTDFHFFDADPIGIVDINSYSGPGTASFDALFQINILGLSIASGSSLVFSIDENCGIAEACSLGGAIWQGFPTTDGDNGDNGVQPVPEPSTLFLLGAGLIVATGLRRRRHA